MIIVMNGTALVTGKATHDDLERFCYIIHKTVQRHNEAGRPLSGDKP